MMMMMDDDERKTKQKGKNKELQDEKHNDSCCETQAMDDINTSHPKTQRKEKEEQEENQWKHSKKMQNSAWNPKQEVFLFLSFFILHFLTMLQQARKVKKSSSDS